MINNPSQRQIDTKHPKDIVAISKPPIMYKLLEYFIDKITGRVPEYIIYEGKRYRSEQLTIYKKEEVASMRVEDIKAVVGPTGSKYKTMANIELSGNINRVSLDVQGRHIVFDYTELYYFLKHIEDQYKTACENEKLFEYDQIDNHRLSIYKTKEGLYEFKNGFYLDVYIYQNISNKKYKAVENQLYIYQDKEYDTKEQARKALSDTIEIRLELLKENPRSKEIFKYTSLKLNNENIKTDENTK